MKQVSEPGEIVTVYGRFPYQKGDYIGINYLGMKKVVMQEVVEDYIAVEIKIERIIQPRADLGRAYTEMALLANDESEMWLPMLKSAVRTS